MENFFTALSLRCALVEGPFSFWGITDCRAPAVLAMTAKGTTFPLFHSEERSDVGIRNTPWGATDFSMRFA
jgi:hypothetical protein